jgi:hypothetical protein
MNFELKKFSVEKEPLLIISCIDPMDLTLRFMFNKVTSRFHGCFPKFTSFNLVENGFFWQRHILQNFVKPTQGILGIKNAIWLFYSINKSAWRG